MSSISRWAIQAGLVGCMACSPARASQPGNTSSRSEHWLNGLREPCKKPAPFMQATWLLTGDVDGDGKNDALETTCAPQAEQECVQRLCVASLEGWRMAAAWTSPTPARIIRQESSPLPHSFIVERRVQPPSGPSCLALRQFDWSALPEPGYLSLRDEQCVCNGVAVQFSNACGRR